MLAQACKRIADETAGGRLVAVLEGGYDLSAIDEGVAAVLDVLRGETRTPTLNTGDARRADTVITRARTAQSPYWTL
jgi:acetoin utilization deacetylase AcuC-like enzyme